MTDIQENKEEDKIAYHWFLKIMSDDEVQKQLYSPQKYQELKEFEKNIRENNIDAISEKTKNEFKEKYNIDLEKYMEDKKRE
jgi:hypothetical protein